MRISPINNISNTYAAGTFRAKKMPQKGFSSITHKAILPMMFFASVCPSMLGQVKTDIKSADDNETQFEQSVLSNRIQYKKKFDMDGKRYLMTYENENEMFGKNAVSAIYFTPQKDDGKTLRLEELIKQNNEDGSYDISAIVSAEGKDAHEIGLPDKIGKKILDLYEGKTKLFVIPGMNFYTDK